MHPQGLSTGVEIEFDNYNWGYNLKVHDTQQSVATLFQTALHDPSGILTFSDGYSRTIVAKIAHIANVAVSTIE